MWNIKYNSLDNDMKKLINDKFVEKAKLFHKYIKLRTIMAILPGFLFFIVFIVNIFTIIKVKKFKLSIIVFLIFQTYKIWRDLDVFCSNFIHIQNNIKNINLICSVWNLEKME